MNVEELKRVADTLEARIYREICPLQIEAWITREPVLFADRTQGEHRQLKLGDPWSGELFDCAWFKFSADLPDDYVHANVYALLDINGEMLVVDHAGNPVEGLTNRASHFGTHLGMPGKVSYELPEQGVKHVEIWADGALNDLFGSVKEDGRIVQASLNMRNEKVYRLYYDFMFVLSLFEAYQYQHDEEHQKTVYSLLENTAGVLRTYSDREVDEALEMLAPYINDRSEDEVQHGLKLSAIGHAHLDLAWLWPIRETYRKGARTFSTALRSMERYPDYVFGASQPQLYEWIQKHYPTVFERVKQRVEEGRWEVQGGMWVECDTNLVSCESLIRQFLYGIRYYLKAFGTRVNGMMLPDTFGFSGALPQIMKLAGINYFVTMKPAWNTINKFPHNTFIWKGIDGSEVPAHNITEATYNGRGNPLSIGMVAKDYAEKEVSDHALLMFGIGDGGGGPGLYHLESMQRSSRSARLPSVKQEPIETFYERWVKQSDKFPLWNGEIYLERHQGTFTTHGKIKRANRKTEHALQKCELLASASSIISGERISYQEKEMFDDIWKETLLYQFHDILPGSSIRRVYDEAMPCYARMLEALNAYTAGKVPAVVAGEGAAALNYTSFEREEWVKDGNCWKLLSLPPMGYAVNSGEAYSEDAVVLVADRAGVLENERLKVTFSEDGWITSIHDKHAGREVIHPAGKANVLSVYEDTGSCWDFPKDYRDKLVGTMTLISAEYYLDGPRAIAKMKYAFGKSRLEQETILMSGSARIDFKTVVDWQDPARMLRVSFDVDVHSDHARYEIQGGYVERPTHDNTSWDRAKEEVPAQRWADLSQADYGVALLNDCKYGHRIKGNRMELTLLRSAKFPGAYVSPDDAADSPKNSHTDLECHEFTYAVLPHAGNDLMPIIKQAAFLNIPVEIYSNGTSDAHVRQSLFQTDNDSVVIQSVKPAEDDNSIIVRLYEALGERCECRLTPFRAPASARLCNLLEEDDAELSVNNGSISLALNPFQIVSVKIHFGECGR